MAAPSFEPWVDFDPLADFAGVWTPELADRYLPIPGMPPAKYECQDGRLILSPYEGSANTLAAHRLVSRFDEPARAIAARAYPTLNVQLAVNRWIQPDFAVLREPARGRVWIPATNALLVGECVSPSSRRSDKIDKPAMCAAAGIEVFMRVEVSYANRHAEIVLLQLDGDNYTVQAKALAGTTFETDVPFPLRLDPAELLED